MKFPISLESLQAFDYSKEQEEELREEELILEEELMEEELSEEELREEEIKKNITLIIKSICEEFKQGMPQNSKKKCFVWRNINTIRQLKMDCIGYNSKMDTYLPQFIDKLKEVFIGCDITIDPFKTYLVIDWS